MTPRLVKDLKPTVFRRSVLRVLLMAGGSCWLSMLSGSGIVGQEKKSPPRPREFSPEEREAVQEWWQTTSLTEGEILKRIAPPFPACRAVAHSVAQRHFSHPMPVPDVMCIRWRPGITRSGGGDHVGPASLSFIVDRLLGIAVERQEIEGDPKLLNSPIDGDWIVREGVPVEKALPHLEEILRSQCKLPVKLKLDQVEREVIVVKGKYQFAPISDRDGIRLYGRVLTERPGGGGSGTFEKFVQNIGRFIHRRIVSEVASPPEGRLRWGFNSPFPKVEGWNDRDQDSVLTHLSEQTGLVFVNEKRKVPIVFVDRAE